MTDKQKVHNKNKNIYIFTHLEIRMIIIQYFLEWTFAYAYINVSIYS